MGLFKGQLANVVEWQETRDDVIFYKWNNDEIKRGSRLIIRPGQDAIFMYNGRTEGIFKEEGNYDIESDIIPFLSSLKGFRFGFNSGLRAEVLFVNTKEFVMKWGTKQAINLPNPSLPGGMPIRANGTFQFKVGDYEILINRIAGVKKQFTTEEVRERVLSVLDQLLLQWIVREGKDMFNIQANAREISAGIMADLDKELRDIGLAMTGFQINTVSYPEEIQKMITKVASQSMVGDMNRYQQMAVLDSMTNGNTQGGHIAADMASMQMGMAMGQQMMNQMNPQAMNASYSGQGYGTQNGAPTASDSYSRQGYGTQNSAPTANGSCPGQSNASQIPVANQSREDDRQAEGARAVPNFCPNCGQKTNGANFCSNCGQKLV